MIKNVNTENEKVRVTKTCKICNKDFDFWLTIKQIDQLHDKELQIQQILKNFKPGDREMFISGFCDSCYNELFKGVE